MGSPVMDLEAGLQAMLNLKPPGVSGSRIASLTSLCVTNIQSESVLIQKIYTHFKKAPGTHKLGVLYVVDSVTRKWLEQAKAHGQTVNSSAPDGTETAAVNRVTELMPVLMNDILQHMPSEQKEKIKKLLDIWEKGQTFPQNLIDTWKQKLNAPPVNGESTTPPGSPPSDGLVASLKQPSAPAPPPPAQNGSSILEALANMARQNTNATPPIAHPALQAPAPAYSVPPAVSGLSQPTPSSSIPQQPQAPSYPQTAQAPFNMSSLPFALPQAAPPSHVGLSSNPQAPTGGAIDTGTQQQIMLIKALADQGVPFDKIPALLQTLGSAGVGGVQPQPTASLPPQNTYSAAQPSWAPALANQDGHRNPGGYQDSRRSPPKYGRSRSRSPDRGWDSRGSPRGGREYGRDSPRDGRRLGDYRNRSPPGRRGRSPDPHDGDPGSNKWVDNDPTLPSGTIRVLSRTLFVGGVTCPEPELRSIFARFGPVQSCIVNKDKRHAFIKMLTRRAAVAAKEGTEDMRDIDVPLRTRWGVGFGPRDCSDYATGISVIPIHRLTEADRKWMLTAPYGGSGGRPIETGLVVEEPDIEIGAGVSSKAISRRMQTDKGGSNGPKSTRSNPGPEDRYGKRRDPDNGPPGNRGDPSNPGVPEFPFGIGTLPNGMPNFPTGFAFPSPQQNTNIPKWA